MIISSARVLGAGRDKWGFVSGEDRAKRRKVCVLERFGGVVERVCEDERLNTEGTTSRLGESQKSSYAAATPSYRADRPNTPSWLKSRGTAARRIRMAWNL